MAGKKARATHSAPKPAITRSHDWRPVFLAALGKTGIVADSAMIAAIDRGTAYREKETNPAFASAWATALEDAGDVLEREAWRRAVEGLVRKKFTKSGDPIIDPETGQQYFEREYSDTLIAFLLKGTKPGKFRDNIHHTSDGTLKPEPVVLVHSAPPPPKGA